MTNSNKVTYRLRLCSTFRTLRFCNTQSAAHCLLVQLLQGNPMTAASHFTLRKRQGIQALLAVTERFTDSSDGATEDREMCFAARAMMRRYETATHCSSQQ